MTAWLTNLLHFSVLWLITAALIGGGAYLFVAFVGVRFIRIAGALLVALGLMLGAFTVGQITGEANCKARWEEANRRAEKAIKETEERAERLAEETIEKYRKATEEFEKTSSKEIEDAKAEASKLSSALAGCRLASESDLRRVCRLTGNQAPGCENYR